MTTMEATAALRQYEIQLCEAYPQGFLYITSLRNTLLGSTAGSVAQVNTKVAAKAILQQTARPSTDEEINAYEARGEAFQARTNAVTQQAANPTVVIQQGPQ